MLIITLILQNTRRRNIGVCSSHFQRLGLFLSWKNEVLPSALPRPLQFNRRGKHKRLWYCVVSLKLKLSLFPTLQTENIALWSSTNSKTSQDLNCSDIQRPPNEMLQATGDSHKFTPYWLWHSYIFAQSGSTLSWLLLVTFSKPRETFILHTQSNVKWL